MIVVIWEPRHSIIYLLFVFVFAYVLLFHCIIPFPCFITQLNSSHISKFGMGTTYRISFMFIPKLKESFTFHE